MTIQYVSFFLFFLLLTQFYYEFYCNGLEESSKVPLFGGNYSSLTGVVLFNYAFAITVPSWLNEKNNDVSVNKVIWSSALLSTLVYISFSILSSQSFSEIPPNILILLGSRKVSVVTRLCSVLFGVFIIGSGIPTFLIMIRTSLYHGGVFNENVSLFFGAYLPFCLSWLLYQGNILLRVLNWTGLIVNSLVAFVLPLLLTLYAIEKLQDEVNSQNNEEIIDYQIIDDEHRHYSEIVQWEEQKSCGCGAPYSDIDESKKWIRLTSSEEPYDTMEVDVAHISIATNTFSIVEVFMMILDHITSNTRLKYLYLRDTIQPLPEFINIKTKTVIVKCVLIAFIFIIVTNIIMCNIYGFEVDDTSSVGSKAVSSFTIGGFSKRLN